MRFDIPTLMQMLILLTALLSLSTALVSRSVGAGLLRPWWIALLLLDISYIGYALRGIAPDWLSIVVANVTISAAYALMAVAVANFNGTTVRRTLLVAPAVAVLCLFPWIIDRQDLRNIASSVIHGGQLVLVLLILYRHDAPESGRRGRGQILFAVAIAASAAILLFRLVQAAISGPESVAFGIKDQHPYQVLIMVASILAVMAASIGFILMVLERAVRTAGEQTILLGAILDSVTESIIMFDRDGKVLQTNSVGAQRFHATPETLVGKRLDQIAPPDIAATRLAAIQHVSTSGQPAELLDEREGRSYQINFYPVRGRSGGAVRHVVTYAEDITDNVQAERHLSFLTQRSLFLLELPRLAENLDDATLMQRGLEMAEELTDSVISFIHFVNENEETIELITWSRRTLESYCHAVFDRHYPVSQAGIWAEALRQRQPVVFNDYASASNKRGLPEGHAHLQRLISVPVIEHGNVVMLAGIGNKPSNYSQQDIETLQLIANDIWRLVQRKRSLDKISRFSSMIERSLNEIFSFDAESLKFLDANRGALENIGYPIDELRQMTPLDIKPDISAQAFDELLLPLRNGDVPLLQFTTRHQRKDGSSYPVEIHLEMTDEAHPIFVAVARDISERINNEHDLKLALQVIEASPMVSFRWRATDDWPVDYVSSNITRWGYSVDQMVAGTPRYSDIIHPDDLTRAIDEVTRHITAGTDSFTQEYRVRAADAHYFWVEDHTRILRRTDGTPEFFEGVVNDIDAKKCSELALAANLEQQQQLNKKLEEAHNQLLQAEKMASIGQLAAGVAHELNNPIGFVHSNLGTLEGYLRDIFQITDTVDLAAATATHPADFAPIEKLMQEKEFAYIKSDTVQLMAESKDGLARVRKIVQDLKDFSRPGETDWQWTNLHQGLDSTLNIVWNELKYKCTVVKHYAPDLPQINCLASQLNQVFMNLLLNAAHAIQTTGVITIATERDGDSAVRIRISDNGAGIPPENLKRIFEPFFTTKPIGKGTGLGLSIAWGIVAKHHGRIEVTSTVGQGTTFELTLPTNPSDQNGEPNHADTST